METATWARRILALVVDWFASTLVVILVARRRRPLGGGPAVRLLRPRRLRPRVGAASPRSSGGSFGQLATRLRVVREDGDPRPIAPHLALARQLLIALVIPPLVYRPDGRGLHDLAAGSAVVTLQTYRALAGKP